LGFIKNLKLRVSKDIIEKLKRQHTTEYLQSMYAMRDLYPQYRKNSAEFNRKINNMILKMSKELV
jgi:hypothetical protein